MAHLSLNSPLGALTIFEEDDALVALEWGWTPASGRSLLLSAAVDQLNAYFEGAAVSFDVPMKPRGTPFQCQVWRRLAGLSYGATMTYGTLATALATGPRAVARACAANPLPIIIPCHRIVAADGGLGGYSGGDGLDTKRTLLRLEGAIPSTEAEDAV